VFCQGPYEESARYRDFMGGEMPWHLVCYLRQGSQVFETYWMTARGVEYMDNSYRLLDLTVCGRQECTYTRTSTGPPNWDPTWPGGRPISQWPRLEAGRSDDLGTALRRGR
jgi:predicted dithiol-disulfide oxidoreductase (DUF899 family)